MPAHTTVPACNIFILDYSYPPNDPEIQHCPTCGSAQHHVAEIDVSDYAEAHGMDARSPTTRHAAIQRIKDSIQSPDWLRNAQQFQDHDNLITCLGPLSCTHHGVITPTSRITGRDHDVYIDDKPLTPDRSLRVTNHSPSGFSWGYGGSGPAQLALALLLEAGASEMEAQRHHQDFKWAHIAKLDTERFDLPGTVVIESLALYRSSRTAP